MYCIRSFAYATDIKMQSSNLHTIWTEKQQKKWIKLKKTHRLWSSREQTGIIISARHQLSIIIIIIAAAVLANINRISYALTLLQLIFSFLLNIRDQNKIALAFPRADARNNSFIISKFYSWYQKEKKIGVFDRQCIIIWSSFGSEIAT